MPSFSVCTTCFHLTDPSGIHTQRCRCDSAPRQRIPDIDCPSGYLLCVICARAQAGGTTRWSWEACDSCKAVSRELANSYGLNVPLGRHSIMNRVVVPMSVDEASLHEGVAALRNFGVGKLEQYHWGNKRAKTLFASVSEWRERSLIPVPEWESQFPIDREHSLEAFLGFVLAQLQKGPID